MKTTKAAVVRALECLGYQRSYERQTSKYRVYTLDDLEVLIGRSGGVRQVGRGKPISQSVSLTDTITHRVLEQLGRDCEIVQLNGEEMQAWAQMQFARLARGVKECQPALSRTSVACGPQSRNGR